MKRETSRTLPSGQVINHEYGLGSAPGASWHKVTTGISPNFRWTKTVYDGFGRTLEVINGYKVGATETALSNVVTRYTPCACSSIGKTEWVTMPIAPTDNPLTAAKTVYEYDAIGRTVKVTPPGNAGFTSYEYGGTTVKTIDPKGKWKKFENDALGNLIKVREPRPGGGADYETVYTYTMLGKLHTVTMARPGKGLNPATVTQVRTFTYNAGGQTTSISHPENGTVSFLYNPDGSVQRKTDALSQRVEWSYTPEGRPATVQKYWANGTEDTCSKVTYEYGAQTIDGGFAGANLQGRVASATTGSTGQKGGKIDELYSYNVAGAVVTKRVRITRGVSTVTKDIVYTYDGEGKLASTKYPDEAKPWVMGYDAMARPNGLTQEWWDSDNNQWVNRQWVNGVSYGTAGQLLGMSAFSGVQNFAEVRFTETREYNERLQMTRQRTLQGATVAMDLRYVFTNGSNPNNDGRILQRENVLSGETVEYTYGSLNRLATAATTSAAWGLSFDYDGFGNRWEQLVTKGTAPGNVVSFNQATNRINSSLYSHDANGNMLSTPTVSGMTYDVENRLLTANGNGSVEEFAYLWDNKRVWKKANAGSGPVEQYYLYGVGGQRIATYSAVYSGGTLTLTYANKDVYFGGRVIWQNGRAVVQDRLGSVMARGNGTGGVETHDCFPYGEERTATVGDRNKFGTYHRDQTGLDYADQRYYNSAIGRFSSPDPAGIALPGNNGTISLTSAMASDPVNYNDAAGNREERVAVEVCHVRREIIYMYGDGPDQWKTSNVCEIKTFTAWVNDVPSAASLETRVSRSALIEACVKATGEYLDASLKHYRRVRADEFVKSVVEAIILEAGVAAAVGAATGSIIADSLGPAVEGVVSFSTALEAVVKAIPVYTATMLAFAVRAAIDYAHYEERVYRPAAAMIIRDCEQVTPSGSTASNQ